MYINYYFKICQSDPFLQVYRAGYYSIRRQSETRSELRKNDYRIDAACRIEGSIERLLKQCLFMSLVRCSGYNIFPIVS